MSVKRLLLSSLVLGAMVLPASFPGYADASVDIQVAEEFDAEWMAGVRNDARKKGVSDKTLDAALKDIQPLKRVIELDRKQPEKTMTFADYKKKIVSAERIARGQKMFRENREILEKVGKKFGVQPQYIVALWGIETYYGTYTGGFGVVEALATLAYDGRRSSYFRGELMDALKILEEGHIKVADMKGSWAGAMGQSQFMPSSFMRYAVDHNGDGRRDIWTTREDVFASAANYLSNAGWKGDERWGRKVRLPKGFNMNLADLDTTKTVNGWAEMGVRNASGGPLPKSTMKGSIVMPDGPEGEAYLVYNNYRSIMRWNRSTYFATSVGLLADRIAAAR